MTKKPFLFSVTLALAVTVVMIIVNNVLYDLGAPWLAAVAANIVIALVFGRWSVPKLIPLWNKFWSDK